MTKEVCVEETVTRSRNATVWAGYD